MNWHARSAGCLAWLQVELGLLFRAAARNKRPVELVSAASLLTQTHRVLNQLFRRIKRGVSLCCAQKERHPLSRRCFASYPKGMNTESVAAISAACDLVAVFAFRLERRQAKCRRGAARAPQWTGATGAKPQLFEAARAESANRLVSKNYNAYQLGRDRDRAFRASHPVDP